MMKIGGENSMMSNKIKYAELIFHGGYEKLMGIVLLTLVASSILAPLSRSKLTISVYPNKAAEVNGVLPSCSYVVQNNSNNIISYQTK
jgi:hypothetical protein